MNKNPHPLQTPAAFKAWYSRELAKGSLTMAQHDIARLAYSSGYFEHAASVVRSGSAAAELVRPEWFTPGRMVPVDPETTAVLLTAVRALLVDNQRISAERLKLEQERDGLLRTLDNVHERMEGVYARLGVIEAERTQPKACALGCKAECKAELHGCASECPALPARPPFA